MTNKRNILILVITLSLILVTGSSFAYLVYTKESTNDYVINVGTLEVTFVDAKTNFLTLSDMYPMTDEEGESLERELVFQVKNTGNVDARYSVYMDEVSTDPEFKTVIKYIVSKDNQDYSKPKVLNDDRYIEPNGTLKVGETSEYHVKVWLDENAGNTYMNKTFKAKVVVDGSQVLDNGVYTIKSTLGRSGGVIGVSKTNEKLTSESEDIREYRYSGLNVNNYVTFNDEVWRIVGVFKDENGAEHLKIVRNDLLTKDMFPETFEAEGTTYNIYTGSDDYVYWSSKVSGNNNDWATAGLQYWLNAGSEVESENPSAGYMSYLSKNAKELIEETKYYLGAVTYYNKDMNGGSKGIWGLKETTNEVYKNERAVNGCTEGKGPSENTSNDVIIKNENCRVWANNQATWEGKIALLYPSDYGYSTDSQYWNTKLGYGTFNGTPNNNSWLQQTNHTFHEWLLSPSSNIKHAVAHWHISGNASASGGNDNIIAARPTLYLKSEVKITSGDGTQDNAYQLEI